MALSPWFGSSAWDFPFGRVRDPMDFGGSLFPSLSSVAPSAATAHPLDVIETNDAYKITLDTPGMDASDINITMSEGVLTVAGRKKQEHEEKDREGRVLRRERAFSSFSRSFTMPNNVEEDKISANLHNGVLEVTVAKVAPPPMPEPKRITINTMPSGQETPKITQQGATAQ